MSVFAKPSIGQKLIGSFIFVLIVLGVQSYLSTKSLSHVNEETTGIVNVNQPALVRALELKSQLHDTGRNLGFFLVTHQDDDRKEYQESFDSLWQKLNALRAEPAIQGQERLLDRMEMLHAAIRKVEEIEQELAEISIDPVRNMPAMRYASETFNPEYRERLQLLNAMIEEEQQKPREERQGIYHSLVSLRYHWTALNNEQRVFLAFRTPAAIENATMYKAMVRTEVKTLLDLKDAMSFEQEDAFERFEGGLDAYWTILNELFRLHTSDDWRQDAHLLRMQLLPALRQIDAAIQGLVSEFEDDSRRSAESASALFQSEKANNIVMFALAFVVLGLLGLFLLRSITRPIRTAVEVADEIAQGHLDNEIVVRSQDELGELLSALSAMQEDLRLRIEADARTAAENLRIRHALDNVATAVTVFDSRNKLIYLNLAAQALMKSVQQEVSKRHPDFRADALLGRRFPDYLDDPAVKSAYQGELKEQASYDTVFGGRNLHMVARPVYDDRGKLQGRVTQWTDVTEDLRAAQEERQRIAAERVVAAENARIRSALDNVSSNLMLTDDQRRIIYMNRSAETLFRERQEEIRRELPGFDPDRMIGASIDDFHSNQAHQSSLLSQIRSTHEVEVQIGELSMKITATPVFDDEGRRLGTAVEWVDRTQELAVEREIDGLIDAARVGDLSRRILLEGKHGFFLQLGEGFNELLDQLGSVFEDIARVMSRIADGDLNQRINRDYSGTFGVVKNDINRTLANLSEVLAGLVDASDSIASASGEISSGNSNLSLRTEKQASSLEETASSLEQLTSTVRNNASNAQQANQLATAAQHSALRGGEVVSDTVSAMQEIRAASNHIAEIIGVIDEIAFQTNLLALNASVEAARAGEQGRGFAVVASEVRNLASRSADAAKEIRQLIEDSMTKVHAGTELVNASGETLGEIVANTKEVGDIIADIATASVQQAAGIEQVNHAVATMDEMTQQNATLAEQTSAASASMSEKAAEMQRLVAFFQAGNRPDPAISAFAAQQAVVIERDSTISEAQRESASDLSRGSPGIVIERNRTAATHAGVSLNATDGDEWEEF